MGRRKSKKGGRAGGGNARYDKVDIVKENERFERYYGELRLFSDDDDGAEAQAKGELWAALRRELPNSFRFTGSRG